MHAKTTQKVKIMEIFKLTLSQMLMMFTLIAAGVLLRKAAVLNTHAGNIMARLETYVFVPPLGLNTIVYPAAYGGDTKTGASMTMISHVLSVITIPLMYLVFIVWL